MIVRDNLELKKNFNWITNISFMEIYCSMIESVYFKFIKLNAAKYHN